MYFKISELQNSDVSDDLVSSIIFATLKAFPDPLYNILNYGFGDYARRQ
jgi:hypothetical protein